MGRKPVHVSTMAAAEEVSHPMAYKRNQLDGLCSCVAERVAGYKIQLDMIAHNKSIKFTCFQAQKTCDRPWIVGLEC